MSSPELHQLVYVSSATKPFPQDELLALLAQSRRRNTESGVTGMLLYRDGNFMQVLEGPRAAVLATHERIVGDSRHRGLITLRNTPVAARSFPDWSMAFRNLELSASPDLPGYSDFLNQAWSLPAAAGEADAARKLLAVFRRSARS
jgi:hypothetical protein